MTDTDTDTIITQEQADKLFWENSPWNCGKLGNNAEQYEVYSQDGKTIAVTHNDEGGRHAILMSAAPILLRQRNTLREQRAWLADIARELVAWQADPDAYGGDLGDLALEAAEVLAQIA